MKFKSCNPLILTFCFSRTAISANDIRFTLYPLCFIVSAIFLAATLATGWLLPASHHVLHWRCQTHHVACLMVGDLFMAIIQLAGNSLTGELCKAVGESTKIVFPFLTWILFLSLWLMLSHLLFLFPFHFSYLLFSWRSETLMYQPDKSPSQEIG